MEGDALPPGSATRRRHVDLPFSADAESPKRRGAAVAQDRSWAVCEHRGQPTPVPAQLRDSARINAPMDGMQSATFQPPLYASPADSNRLQLPAGNNPVLLISEPS
jgi:hypothetical protein